MKNATNTINLLKTTSLGIVYTLTTGIHTGFFLRGGNPGFGSC